MKRVFIALGTNIEPREQHLTDAIERLTNNEYISMQKKSSIYQTAPVGYADQADFLNMVIEIGTSLTALDLLDLCQGIERCLGRKRNIRFGPRTIDLDILVYNQENRQTERLIIPHPRMHERAFVLIPLEEIAPELVIPKIDKRVADLINELSEEAIKDVNLYHSAT
jgi:2-amino-4-hydroxy-6-hydroxymethyldihydropteridine diphosphokinase